MSLQTGGGNDPVPDRNARSSFPLPPATVWEGPVLRLPLQAHLREQLEVEPARRYQRYRRTAMLESPWWPLSPTT